MIEKNKPNTINAEKNKKINTFFSYLLAFLIIPTFICLAFFSTLHYTIFNPDFHKKNLIQTDAYNRLIQDGVPSVILSIKNENENIYDQLIRRGAILVFQKFVTNEWLQSQTEIVIDQGLAYLSTPGNPDKILSELKTFQTQYLPKASNLLSTVESSIPACEDKNNIIKGLFPAIDCNNINYTLDQVREEVKSIRVQALNIEGQVNSYINQAETYIILFFALRNFISSLGTYIFILSLLVALYVIILAILQYRNISSMLKWLAAPFIIASVFTLLITLAIKNITSVTIESLALNINPEIDAIIRDILSVTSSNFICYLKTFAGITLGISVALLIAGCVVKRVNWEKPRAKAKSFYHKIVHKKKHV